MAVTTETKSGTMTNEEGRKNISPETEVKTPAGKEVSPEEEPRIYTQNQANALIHAKDSEWGRKFRAVETERDGFKSKLERKESELVDNATEIETLQAKFDEMAKDDPAKFDVAKELKASREERRQLKTGLAELETSKKTHSEEIKLAQDTLREIRIWEIAEEYTNADPTMLKNLCDTFEAKSEEQIRKAADTIWAKLTEPEEKKTKAPKPYSGKNDGGSPYFTRAQIADRKFYLEHKEEIIKAGIEGRIRD